MLPGATVPMEAVCNEILSDLIALDDMGAPLERIDTDAAAGMLGVSPKTVAHWCAAGRFPGALKTGASKGKWVIPTADVGAITLRGAQR